MSALAKPMIFSAAVTNPVSGVNSALVAADFIKSVSKVVVEKQPNSNTPRYEIVFEMLSTDNQTRSITWKFADEVTLDAELVKVYNFIAAVVV